MDIEELPQSSPEELPRSGGASNAPQHGEPLHDEPLRYEYRCVAAPAVVTVRRTRERLKSVHALEETLNRESTNGWEYVGIDELAILEPQSFWSRKKQRTSFKIIVFRRPAR